MPIAAPAVRGGLCHRAAGRHCRARSRDRARCASAAQLHQAGRHAVPTAIGQDLRFRRFRRASGAAPRRSPTGLDSSRRAQSKKAGRLRGIGLSTYVEACGSNGPETAIVRIERDGGVTVLIGSQSTGQGHAHRLRAARRRASRPAAGARRRGAGRHRPHRQRRRHRRLELDPLRRRLAGRGGKKACGQSESAGRRSARSRRRRSRDRRWVGARRRHRSRDLLRRARATARCG